MLAAGVVALLAGCGQVIVFGHGMGERPEAVAKPATTTETTSTTEATSATKAAPPAAGTAAPTTPTPGGTPAPHSTAPTSSAPLASTSPHAAHVVKSVNIIITPEAAAKVTGDASRFTADALLDAIKTELTSRKLLDDQNPDASGTAEIVVDDLATRPTTNAILSGYKMLAGTLEGDIRVIGSPDTDSTGTRIVAQSKLTLAASGDDKNPLGPLYRRFAVLAADRLAGVTSKPEDPTGIPRF